MRLQLFYGIFQADAGPFAYWEQRSLWRGKQCYPLPHWHSALPSQHSAQLGKPLHLFPRSCSSHVSSPVAFQRFAPFVTRTINETRSDGVPVANWSQKPLKTVLQVWFFFCKSQHEVCSGLQILMPRTRFSSSANDVCLSMMLRFSYCVYMNTLHHIPSYVSSISTSISHIICAGPFQDLILRVFVQLYDQDKVASTLLSLLRSDDEDSQGYTQAPV